MCALILKSSQCPHGRLTCCLLLAGRRCLCPGWLCDHLIVHHQWEYSLECVYSCSKVPNAPMGKWLTCLPRLTLAQLRMLRSTTVGTCYRDLPIAPMGFSHVLHLCLQGGGVFVQSGTVTISSSTISGNTALLVRASLACKSPLADVLASTHACTIANASVNYTVCTCHRDYTWKLPIATPDSRFVRCLQGGGVYVSSGTVTLSLCTISGNRAEPPQMGDHVCHSDLEKFPLPRWEIADLGNC